ncbi:GLPGLI family protein [Flavobacterium sp. SUN046]|uniref:GLPGLI family protein n=1 Tax=Flavobacterium sp. SUN046 TaxID=3002440 RepID=UPI002DBBA6CB|nr:GLPGLI family protein [Flavobacterium sp. SUN046]MEC4048671.1 GLPGLI family protein [Flavobacterium sp. SUN046]
MKFKSYLNQFLIGLLLLISQFIVSQKSNLYIEYKVVMSKNPENMDLNSDFGKIYLNALRSSKSLLFNLYITDKEEYFCVNDSILSASIASNFIKNLSGYSSPIYYDKSQNTIYEDHDDPILGKYVLKKERKSIIWQITNETKEIDGFLCYKAIADDVVVNSFGNFKYQLTAWFTQNIPVSSGPLGIGGLPGLILELNRRNVSFGASMIKFMDHTINSKIIKPKMNKTISEDDVKKLREDFINSKD